MRIAVALIMSAVALFAQSEQTTTRLNIRPYTPSGGGTSVGEIRFYDIIAGGGSYISLFGQSQVNANYNLALPKETATLMATENHAYGGTPFTFATYRAAGTEASPSDISAGNTLGHWTGYGRTSGSYSQMAGVQLTAATTTTGSVDFYTRNAGGYNPRINISEDGHIYPYGVGTQDVGASSVRFRKGWFTDLDVSGTCTGCGGSPPITWTLETNADILTMQHHLSSGSVARNILTQYSRGTNASPTAASAGDSVFTMKWQYYAGGAYRDAGAIFVNAPSGSTVSSTSSPGQVSIFGTKHAETAGTEVVRFGAQTFSETPNWGARFFATAYPSANLTYDLGVFGAEWLTAWVSRIRTSGSTNIDFYPGNTQRWSMSATDGTITPSVDTGPKIGSVTQRLHSTWAMAYNTYSHNSWGVQTHDWSADNTINHRMSAYGTGQYSIVDHRRARNTLASPAAVANTDTIGYTFWQGYSPSGAFALAAGMEGYVDGTPSGSVVPGGWRIYTTSSGGSFSVRLTARANGDIEIPGNLIVSGTCTGCGSVTPPVDWYLNSGSTVLTLGNHGNVVPNQLFTKFSRGSQSSPSDASIGDIALRQIFQYYAGGAYRDTAAILVDIPTVSASVSGSSSPSRLAIYATDRATTTNSRVIEFGAHDAGFGIMARANIQSSGNNAHDLGASGYEWFQIWTSKLKSASSLEFHSGGSQRWSMSSSTGTLFPATDGGPSIGSIVLKPAEIWAREFNTYTPSSAGTQINAFSADANLNLELYTFSSTAADRASLQFFRYRGSVSSPSAVQSGDQMGNIAWQGLGSSSTGLGAVIRVYSTGSAGSNYIPTEMWFQTTTTGGSLGTNLIIRDNGEADFAAAVDAVSGFKYNGTAGVTTTVNVRNAADTGSCSFSIQGGIITATTC